MARTTQKVAADTNVSLAKNTFTRAGYRFDKWNTKADGTGTSYADEATVNFGGDVLLYAIWRLATPTVILKSNSDSSIWPLINASFSDGVVDKTVVATYGENYPTSSISVPTSQGYTFDKWKCSNNNQFYNNLSSTICNIDADIITFLAQWKANSYTVTLDQQSGTGGTTSVSATYGKNMPSMSKPTRAGHTFGGYFTGTSGTGTQYYTSSGASARAWNIAGDRTLYAKWLAGTYYLQSFEPRIYDTWWSERSPEVDFALNVPDKNVEQGQAIGPLPVIGQGIYDVEWPAAYMSEFGRYAQSFSNGHAVYSRQLLGWYTSKSGGTKVTSSAIVTGSTTYYAKWKWTLTWNNASNVAQGAWDDHDPRTFFGILPSESKYRLIAQGIRITWTAIDLNDGYDLAIMPCYTDGTNNNFEQPCYYGYYTKDYVQNYINSHSPDNPEGTKVTSMWETQVYSSNSDASIIHSTLRRGIFYHIPAFIVHCPKGSGEIYVDFGFDLEIPNGGTKYNLQFMFDQVTVDETGHRMEMFPSNRPDINSIVTLEML